MVTTPSSLQHSKGANREEGKGTINTNYRVPKVALYLPVNSDCGFLNFDLLINVFSEINCYGRSEYQVKRNLLQRYEPPIQD